MPPVTSAVGGNAGLTGVPRSEGALAARQRDASGER
jgi:hypothetical protein